MCSNGSALIRCGKMNEEKEIYWSAVKGICILCVIIIHLSSPLVDGQLPVEYWLLRRCVAFPVGMFFALAGFFVHPDRCSDRTYIRKKITRLLVPYLVFTTIYLIRSSFEVRMNWKGVLASYLLGTAEVQLYYCLYLIQMILLLPLLNRLVVLSRFKLCNLLLLAAVSAVWSYLKLYLKVLPDACSVFCFSFLFYYALGLYLKGLAGSEEEHGPFFEAVYKWRCGIVAAAFAVCCFEALPQRLTAQITLGNIVYTTALILAVFSVYWVRRPKWTGRAVRVLAYLGNNSFPIYLIHMILMRGMYSLEGKLRYPLVQIVEFVVTLAGSLVIIWGIQKLFKNQKWIKVLGF